MDLNQGNTAVTGTGAEKTVNTAQKPDLANILAESGRGRDGNFLAQLSSNPLFTAVGIF